MFGYTRQGAQAYSNIDMETGVFAASPHKLIVMLFDGAKQALNNALQQMQQNQIAAKGKSISHAILIIGSGLRASLNKDAGGELAENLDALYEYMTNRLLMANINNDQATIQEIIGLLEILRQGWLAIGDKVDPQPTAQPTMVPAANNPSVQKTINTMAEA